MRDLSLRILEKEALIIYVKYAGELSWNPFVFVHWDVRLVSILKKTST
jgi:hypothetical protein